MSLFVFQQTLLDTPKMSIIKSSLAVRFSKIQSQITLKGKALLFQTTQLLTSQKIVLASCARPKSAEKIFLKFNISTAVTNSI